MKKACNNEVWNKYVISCKEAVEDFNDFAQDGAVIWADKELKNYKRAMLILSKSNSDWPMNLSDDDEKFVSTMIRRAEAQKV